MAGGGKDKDMDNAQYILPAQLCELLDQQKAFYKEMLEQQESNFKACVRTSMDTTNSRMDDMMKELQELKVSLHFTQKEMDDLKTTNVSLSLNHTTNETDIHKLAERMTAIDNKTDFLDSQFRRHNVIIEKEKVSELEEKVLTLFKDQLELDHHTIGIVRIQRTGKAPKAEGDFPRPRPHPLLVKLLRIKDRDRVLSNAKKLKGSRIFINKDYPDAVCQRSAVQVCCSFFFLNIMFTCVKLCLLFFARQYLLSPNKVPSCVCCACT